MPFYEHMCSLLLSKYLRVERWGRRIAIRFISFIQNHQALPKVVVPFYVPTKNI